MSQVSCSMEIKTPVRARVESSVHSESWRPALLLCLMLVSRVWHRRLLDLMNLELFKPCIYCWSQILLHIVLFCLWKSGTHMQYVSKDWIKADGLLFFSPSKRLRTYQRVQASKCQRDVSSILTPCISPCGNPPGWNKDFVRPSKLRLRTNLSENLLYPEFNAAASNKTISVVTSQYHYDCFLLDFGKISSTAFYF